MQSMLQSFPGTIGTWSLWRTCSVRARATAKKGERRDQRETETWVGTMWFGGGCLTQERPRPGRLCDIFSDERVVITLAVTEPAH